VQTTHTFSDLTITSYVFPTFTTSDFITATPTPVVSTSSGSSGLSGGEIAGIVIGTVAGVFGLLSALLFCCRRSKYDGSTEVGSRPDATIPASYSMTPSDARKTAPASLKPPTYKLSPGEALFPQSQIVRSPEGMGYVPDEVRRLQGHLSYVSRMA
jgi:hypothetical protein